MDIESLRQKLMKELPPIFTRSVAVKGIGGVYSTGSLANMDSRGEGPPDRLQVGRRTCYERAAFIEWFLKRVCSGRIHPPAMKEGRKR
jgi:hypothetical protein